MLTIGGFSYPNIFIKAKCTDEAKFDSKFKQGGNIISSFWSTAPSKKDAYVGERNLVIKTQNAKDISDLAFGVHFHDKVGKPSYSCENIIPPGQTFKVVRNSGGQVMLREVK